MQVRCNVYGLANASAGVECSIDRSLLEVGEYFHHNDQDYIIVSVVENQGCWFANVVPESQRQFTRRYFPLQRSLNGAEEGETLEAWRERVTRAERRVKTLREERMHFGERLDHLMHMLERLTKESEDSQS
jgi:hypothetical protein